MAVKKRTYSGTKSSAVSAREIAHRQISRKAAAEGVVLLKNEGLLPLDSSAKIVLFGNGIAKVSKGGGGSGDVNEREVVSVLEGMTNAGFQILNVEEASRYANDFVMSRKNWRERVLTALDNLESGSDMAFWGIIMNTPSDPYEEIQVEPEHTKSADAVIYLISRNSGEGADRHLTEGDYYLTAFEKEQIAELAKLNSNIVIVVNSGGQIDISELAEQKEIRSILYIGQPGMEAGNVIADVISGAVCPSGKLATTWSRKYEDFPNAATFSHCNGDTTNEKYEEGLFVGYRYFDAFGVDPLYPFGYGLSYTAFEQKFLELSVEGNQVLAKVFVKNIGDVAGKSIVQLYAACPQEKRTRELKKLIGFGKTKTLAPGESESLTITIDAKNFASYDYDASAWIVDAGDYAIFLAEHAKNARLVACLHVDADCILSKVEHILPISEDALTEISASAEIVNQFTACWKKQAEEMNLTSISWTPQKEEIVRIPERKGTSEAHAIASSMSNEELVALLMGEITKGQDNIVEGELVETGIYVPGAAGETSCQFEEKYEIPAISMADGPAGLRVLRSYDVDKDTGLIFGQGLLSALGGGELAPVYHRTNVDTYYMYATAIPVGTTLAQTWDTELLAEVGEMVGHEMEEFAISWWLAPGMNIHRNPLCGRNFEYYSEDPIIAGEMAAAITNGVQKIPGRGTTIKHFAANNQEDNRLFSNSIVSERTLRELYLRGFEIAVKKSQPECIMTSYNLINGVPAANNKDLITTVLRGEWDFQGIVMTDWTTTTGGAAKSHLCAVAGNDLIMPGHQKDIDDMLLGLESGELTREHMIACATRLIAVLRDREFRE